jgi:hypothetical protein
MIKAISQNGVSRELVLNDTIIMADKYDTLEYEVTWQNTKFIIRFRFDDKGDNLKTTLNPSSDNVFDITLHRWYSSTFVESSTPWTISFNQIVFVVQFRTMATEKLSQRVFHLSIWTDNGKK